MDGRRPSGSACARRLRLPGGRGARLRVRHRAAVARIRWWSGVLRAWRALAWGIPIGCASGREVPARSEEHTSELQSLMRISYAVFCLKKKTKQNSDNNQTTIQNNTHTH